MKTILAATLLLSLAAAQTKPTSSPAPQQTPPPPPVSTAKAEDVSSIDAILAATYDVISGPAGQKRDWDRFRSLFYPGARLIPTRKRSADSVVLSRVISPDEYVERSSPFLEKEGFFERSIADRFGNIAQVFSTYESRHNAADAEPFQRGINSFQLMNDGKRWWILTIMWQGETPENPIPAEYLKK